MTLVHDQESLDLLAETVKLKDVTFTTACMIHKQCDLVSEIVKKCNETVDLLPVANENLAKSVKYKEKFGTLKIALVGAGIGAGSGVIIGTAMMCIVPVMLIGSVIGAGGVLVKKTTKNAVKQVLKANRKIVTDYCERHYPRFRQLSFPTDSSHGDHIRLAAMNIHQNYNMGVTACTELYCQGDQLMNTDLKLSSVVNDLQYSDRLISRLERDEILFLLIMTPRMMHDFIISCFEPDSLAFWKQITEPRLTVDGRRSCILDYLLYDIKQMRNIGETTEDELKRQEQLTIKIDESTMEKTEKLKTLRNRLVGRLK